MYGEASEYKFDQFKDDLEKEAIDAEDRAEDVLNAIEESSGKLTAAQMETLRDVVDTIDTHYDQDSEEADKLYDMITELAEDVSASDEDELAEREEEIADKIHSIERLSRDLGKD